MFAMADEQRFVLDCSIAVAWCFPDEHAPYPQSVLDSLDAATAVVPAIWPLEIVNALLVGERRKRCTQTDTIAWLEFLKALPIWIDDETVARATSETMNLARAQDLSSYDAAYLEIALRLGSPLATLDEKLKVAATAVGVTAFAP
ncbi:MAG TPA: type II toxin-antitoxin system VapC family toxin [Pirellulales bacterium]|nr:type II toxin-antitoxin system VapC family toxin [Pirellulales bacterium]